MSNVLFSKLASLATCLCAQIEQDGRPRTCFCGVIPGDAAVMEYAGNCADACGMAWVRLMTMFPSESVGQASEVPGNCGKELSVIIEVGIMRCIALGDSRGNPPSPEQLLGAADNQVEDALTMQRAILCCPDIEIADTILSAYNPSGPLGGQVGGTWQVVVAV